MASVQRKVGRLEVPLLTYLYSGLTAYRTVTTELYSAQEHAEHRNMLRKLGRVLISRYTYIFAFSTGTCSPTWARQGMASVQRKVGTPMAVPGCNQAQLCCVLSWHCRASCTTSERQLRSRRWL
jgi:hypothetical protein